MARFSWLAKVLAVSGLILTSGLWALGAQDSIGRAAQGVLQKHCLTCHGANKMSDLDLRNRESILRGGTRGPAIVPGKPRESLLFLSAAHEGDLKMPLGSKNPLPPGELTILRQWIEQGASWSGEGSLARAEPSWWSFKKLRRPPLPELKDGSHPPNPIDAFVRSKLEEKDLPAAPRAERLTLVRRAYFDLIGLPPTPEQVEHFLQDRSPNAYANLIEELLASERYGERWGRHWLDVVRYADSAGFEGDLYYPNAWRYRDYVIKSFNEDKPYDRFVQEQIAGDELWPNTLELGGFYDLTPDQLEHLEARIGTTLYTFGPESQESHLNVPLLRYQRLTDWVNTTGAAFLGLSLECARCHDHKFDPLSKKDYFRLQAVFASSWPVTIPVETSVNVGIRDENYHFMLNLDEARRAYLDFEKKVKDQVIESKKKDYPPEVVRAYEIPQEKRTAQESELAAPLVELYEKLKIEEFLVGEEVERHRELSRRLVKGVVSVPREEQAHKVRFDGFYDVPVATVLGHIEPELIPDVYLLDRGDLSRRREKVSAGLPAGLSDETVPEILASDFAGPRYRKQLALWLTRSNHPLTARVMVNRIWQGHFGRGIVVTTNDFGRKGNPPSHPELLNWLACEFVESGWSIKSMHRLMMLSETYQRSSRFTSSEHRYVDPDNRYLWRMNRRRLEGEAIWDSVHSVAGTLNLRVGGRPSIPPLSTVELEPLRRKKRWVTPTDPAEGRRRGVYIMSRRNFTFPMFDKFDVPNTSISCPQREVTTVAPQALWGLNSDVTFRQAREFAARSVGQAGDDSSAWVEKAWRLALAREPSEQEKEEAQALLERLASKDVEPSEESLPEGLAQLGPRRAAALTELCLTIFNLNEFVYID